MNASSFDTADDLINDLQMKIVRNKTGPGSLNFVRTRFQWFAFHGLQNDRRIFRLNRDRFKGRFPLFDDFGYTVMVPPVPTAETRMSTLPIRVGPNLFGGRCLMNGRVGGIVELLRHPGVRSGFQQFLRPGNGAFHSFGSRRENQFGSQHGQERASFQTHRFGHRQNKLVPLRGADKGQGDTGVAAGGFDDDRIGVDDPLLFSGFNHGHANPVLHTAEWIKELAFDRNSGFNASGDAVQFDQRGPAYRLDYIIK